jgi:flagellar hook-basal body complex protein FliE
MTEENKEQKEEKKEEKKPEEYLRMALEYIDDKFKESNKKIDKFFEDMKKTSEKSGKTLDDTEKSVKKVPFGKLLNHRLKKINKAKDIADKVSK